MQRKIILYTGAFEFPDRNAAAQRALANALILRDLGYKVVLIGLSRDLEAGAPARQVEHAGLAFDCWEAPYPGGALDWLKRITGNRDLIAVARAYPSEEIAAVIAYDYPAVSQAGLIRFCRSIGAKAIGEATEWYSVSRPVNAAAMLRNIDRPLRMRVVNPRMDGLIVASTYLHDFYARFGRPVVVVPTLMSDPTPTGGEASPDGAPKRLFFAGNGWDPALVRELREGPKDRLDKVMEALDAARALGAEFVMDIYGVERADYLEIVPAHQTLLERLGERIRFHGRQPRDVVRARLRDADFSIFLRKSSIVSLAGFPTKFAESIHFGTPVITNAVGDVVLYQQEGRTGHFIAYDDVALAGPQLAEILSRSAVEVTDEKRFCLQSKLFFYESCADRMGDFMNRLGLGG